MQADIDRFLSEEYNKDKDPDRPLWIFYILNGLADGRGCMIANIDHCIGDGVSLIQVCSHDADLFKLAETYSSGSLLASG